ncbi:hypothetical protein HMPREF0591_1133, partial [Mycobacterium parascrofulaceum ATCC BAA-614]
GARRGAGFGAVRAGVGVGSGFGLRGDGGGLVVAIGLGFVADLVADRVAVRARRRGAVHRIGLVGVVGPAPSAEPFPSHG